MSEKNFKVSIITVVYNGAKTIEQTILSVLEQSYKNIEYIIIDGLSTDGTQNIVKKYQDSIAYFVSEKDNGLYEAMNKGIQKATGEIVGIINSDDWYAKDAIESIVNYFEQYEVDFVYGDVTLVDQNGRERPNIKKPIDHIWFQCIIQHPGVFVKRSIYEKYGCYNTKYKIAADYDFMLRLYSQNVRFEYIDKVITNFRTGGISSRLRWQAEDEAYMISKSYINNCPHKAEAILMLEEVRKWHYFEIEISNKKEMLSELLCQYFNQKIDRISIFGTGIWGERCYDILKCCGIEIEYFVDNNPSKWNQVFHGIEVVSPVELRIRKANILIAVKEDWDEIKQQLGRLNNRNLKYVSIKELEMLFYKLKE